MFKSILIANRGEIACRIIKTARKMGLRTIAVFSAADENALHVKLADEAHFIGASEATASYLDGAKILAVAKQTGAECIHPGYGFLSENGDFSEACEKAGVVFVGPQASAIRAMGLKDQAKALMEKVNVPVVPGVHGGDQSPEVLAQQAEEIGFPLLIKAVAGGGGKGMRKVERGVDFIVELGSCQREARNSFGDDKVLLEKFIENPRHIEIQIFGDMHGNYVHLFERDCSLQRRHQKVIEEAPAPGMTPELRRRMGEAAVSAARCVQYHGAGTVEFIVPGREDLNDNTPFYFMEMNTRLQVEHPVTELITGLDLVEWQLRVAAGEALLKKQDELEISGHAMEARLYAEDPSTGFLPSPGPLQAVLWPDVNNSNVRIDTGVETGGEVSGFYDPMIAKVIVWGNTRKQALERLLMAMEDTRVLGIKTNAGFLSRLVAQPAFAQGGVDTGFIAANIDELAPAKRPVWIDALATAVWLRLSSGNDSADLISNDKNSPFAQMSGWQLGGRRASALDLNIEGERVSTQVGWPETGGCFVRSGALENLVEDLNIDDLAHMSAKVDGASVSFSGLELNEGLLLYVQGYHLTICAFDLLERDDSVHAGGGTIRAPMNGKLQQLFVKVGDRVTAGDRLAVLEAMKMEHPLVAGISGIVAQAPVLQEAQVKDGDVIIVVVEDDAAKGDD